MSNIPTKGEHFKDDGQAEIDRQTKRKTDITTTIVESIRQGGAIVYEAGTHEDTIYVSDPYWPEPAAIAELKTRFAAQNLTLEFRRGRSGGWICWS